MINFTARALVALLVFAVLGTGAVLVRSFEKRRTKVGKGVEIRI